jgi:ribosomal-protein-alanine N-acetyltransferase
VTGPEHDSVRTERLLLRRYLPEDLDAWHAQIFADPEVMRNLPGGQPVPREQLDGAYERGAKHWETHRYGVWVVCDGDTEELIGHCGLLYLDEIAETEVVYALGRRYWGRGLATEAAGAALEFGFTRTRLERIIALAVPANIASRRVMEHLGMRYEAETRMFDLDLVRYAIDRAGFRARSGGLVPDTRSSDSG